MKDNHLNIVVLGNEELASQLVSDIQVSRGRECSFYYQFQPRPDQQLESRFVCQMTWWVVVARAGSCCFWIQSVSGIIHFCRDRLTGLGRCRCLWVVTGKVSWTQMPCFLVSWWTWLTVS